MTFERFHCWNVGVMEAHRYLTGLKFLLREWVVGFVQVIVALPFVVEYLKFGFDLTDH